MVAHQRHPSAGPLLRSVGHGKYATRPSRSHAAGCARSNFRRDEPENARPMHVPPTAWTRGFKRSCDADMRAADQAVCALAAGERVSFLPVPASGFGS